MQRKTSVLEMAAGVLASIRAVSQGSPVADAWTMACCLTRVQVGAPLLAGVLVAAFGQRSQCVERNSFRLRRVNAVPRGIASGTGPEQFA